MTPERRSSDPKIDIMVDDIAEVKSDLKQIMTVILGDGDKPGLSTKVALNTDSLKRIWWFIGGLCLTVVSKVLYDIIK